MEGGGDLGRTQINAAETMKESLSPLPRKAGQPTDEWTRTTGSTRNANWRRFITDDARAARGERRTDKQGRGGRGPFERNLLPTSRFCGVRKASSDGCPRPAGSSLAGGREAQTFLALGFCVFHAYFCSDERERKKTWYMAQQKARRRWNCPRGCQSDSRY